MEKSRRRLPPAPNRPSSIGAPAQCVNYNCSVRSLRVSSQSPTITVHLDRLHRPAAKAITVAFTSPARTGRPPGSFPSLCRPETSKSSPDSGRTARFAWPTPHTPRAAWETSPFLNDVAIARCQPRPFRMAAAPRCEISPKPPRAITMTCQRTSARRA